MQKETRKETKPMEKAEKVDNYIFGKSEDFTYAKKADSRKEPGSPEKGRILWKN